MKSPIRTVRTPDPRTIVAVVLIAMAMAPLHAQDDAPQYLSAVLSTTSRKAATYYRTREGQRDGLHVGRTYAMDGKLKAEGTYTDPELSIEHGDFVFYHANGNVESRGAYVMGYKSGVWQRYDERGLVLAEKVYDPEALSGIVHGQVQVMPRWRDGDERALVRHVRDRVGTAQGKRPKGAVTTTFVVEPDGQLSGMRVVTGISDQVDQQVVEAIRATGPWEPGIEKGRAVRVRVDLPVRF